MAGGPFEAVRHGDIVELDDLIGEGGQGSVYRCHLRSEPDRPLALKWYFRHTATQHQWAIINELLDRGSPDDRYLWPVDLVVRSGDLQFGYLMPLRPERFVGMTGLMRGKADASFSVIATTGFELADALLQLHALGLCYRDINFGNFAFDPSTGEISICDLDNVSINQSAATSVLGTPHFMAPEILRGEARPSTDTDLHSLAVLLFYLLMLHHPLEGRRALAEHCWDSWAVVRNFGLHPLFIFDPDDDSNRPDPVAHRNAEVFWPLYPPYIRDLFTQAFTDGLHDPANGRVRESVWRRRLLQLRYATIYCGSCGAQSFVLDPPGACWSCSSPLVLPPRLEVAGNVVYLNHDTVVTEHHLTNNYCLEVPSAEMTRHPDRPGVWGLRNRGPLSWQVTHDEETRSVEPGKTATLRPDLQIDFGRVVGTIRS